MIRFDDVCVVEMKFEIDEYSIENEIYFSFSFRWLKIAFIRKTYENVIFDFESNKID